MKSNFRDGDKARISAVQRAGEAENLWRCWLANGPLRARGKVSEGTQYLRTYTGVNGRECVGIFIMSGFYNQ